MLEQAISDKNYWLSKKGFDGRKVFAVKCSEGQIHLSHGDQIFKKITLGLKDTTGDGVGDFTEEDIANGFAIYSIVVYCSEESEQMQSFLSRLVSEETPGTLLKTIINTLHSWKISASLKQQVDIDVDVDVDQSNKNTVSMSAMLTGKFLQMRKVFAGRPAGCRDY